MPTYIVYTPEVLSKTMEFVFIETSLENPC